MSAVSGQSTVSVFMISGQFNAGCNIFLYIKGREGSVEGSVIRCTFALTVLILFFLSYLDVYPEFPNTELLAV